MRLDELTDKAVDYIVKNMDVGRLSDWERGFFESVASRQQAGLPLSDKKRLKLGEIWDRQP